MEFCDCESLVDSKFRIHRKKVNSLSDAREFTILKQRAALDRLTFPVNRSLFRVPEPCLAAILDCRTIHGMFWVHQENVFERLFAREGLPTALFNNSKNLASSSQELRPDIPGNTKLAESEMRRKPQNLSIPVPRFQSGGGLLNRSGGTHSHSGVIDYPGFSISELHLENFLTLWNFKAGKSISKLKCVQRQQILISQSTG